MKKSIKTTLKEFIKEAEETSDLKLVYNYQFDKSILNDFIKNARKWSEKDFLEEYVYLNDISLVKIYSTIKKGDEVVIGRTVRDSSGKNVYINSRQAYAPYKTVIADKDYGTNHWAFILDNTKELQEEAKKLYHQNKKNKKSPFATNEKIIKAYHFSPNKFEIFRQGENKTSGQVGAEFGFFFFKDIKFANYYASVIKENKGVAYIYECDIKLGNTITEKGENIGVGWGRAGWLESADAEGYDSAIIENADTGYGITDEIVVFNDDNIKITKVTKI